VAAPAPTGESTGRRDDRSERRGFERRDDRRPGERRREERRPSEASGFVDWTPPQEDGDDEPLIPSKSGRDVRPRPAAAAEVKRAEPAPRASEALPVFGDDVAYVELFMGIGRRDGTRAQDLLRSLVEQGGVDKDHIRRIRVRDRHAFVAIRKDQAEQAIVRLNGSEIAGKAAVVVELARERAGTDDAIAEAPAEG
jgi:ATP-dependent RNA helicase DeaD